MENREGRKTTKSLVQDKSCGLDDSNRDDTGESGDVRPTDHQPVVVQSETSEGQSHVVIALQTPDAVQHSTNTGLPISKETFVEFGHSEAEAETISQIFIEVCSAESMGMVEQSGAHTASSGEDALDALRIQRDQSVQVNDYEIERSGKLPARRRIIPYKFRDFRNPDSEEEDGGDSDYNPENDFLPVKRRRGAGRGKREVDGEASESVNKPGNSRGRGRGRGRVKGSRGTYRKGKGYTCQSVTRPLHLKGNLRVHLRIHKGEKPFACDFEGCTKSFRTNETMRRHKLAHLGIKPFECEICQKKFSSNVSLREHVSIHNNVRPYQCDKCDKSFRHISTLSRHMSIHSSATPYKCDHCGKQFAQMAYLRSHQRVHTGVKPFTCDQCMKNFAYQSDLIRHKVIHTGLKPYACEVCNARFSDPSSRRRHLKEHVGSKPYPCEMCGEEFKRAGQLKGHLSRIHNAVTETVKVVGDKGTIQFLCKNPSGSRSQKDAEEENKIVQLISSLSRSESLQQISLVGQSQMAGCHANDVDEDTPDADCEQILIEAAQAGEVTVQTMGEQLIVTSLTESIGNHSASQQHEVQLHQQIVETADIPFVEKDVSLEPSAVSAQPNSSVTDSLEEENDEDNVVEYMYGIIEDIGDEDGQGQVVEICCQQEDAEINEGESLETAIESEEQEQEAESNSKAATETLTAVDYVSNPDFSSQGYYNWLSNFTELCKMVPMPLDVDLFQKISQVHKTLSDVMATPSGVLSIKENYKILMSITRDLNVIISEHLAFVLDNLDNSKDSS
ncbi:LOW QUALITY PROTEIN: zinc finger and BTB domain-containing protein 24-like [Liolophura sinensis]|uniref:LOW QUALITY PROTEIN: zinc finger and BTB domain-containing protein 24-like n=1 Tax=Liolophura sinensis TaxID=3198878 RepID=UPI0031597E3D